MNKYKKIKITRLGMLIMMLSLSGTLFIGCGSKERDVDNVPTTETVGLAETEITTESSYEATSKLNATETIEKIEDTKLEEMKNPRVSRRKEILKIRAEINAKETKETIAKIKAKSWFFERINKIDKPLARLIKKQREKNQINKIRRENGEITTDNT